MAVIESPAVMTPGLAFAVETTFVVSPDPPWTPPEVKRGGRCNRP